MQTAIFDGAKIFLCEIFSCYWIFFAFFSLRQNVSLFLAFIINILLLFSFGVDSPTVNLLPSESFTNVIVVDNAPLGFTLVHDAMVVLGALQLAVSILTFIVFIENNYTLVVKKR